MLPESFEYRWYCVNELQHGRIKDSECINMLNSEVMVLRIKGYLEALDLDKTTRDLVLDLCKGYNRSNLTIADEMLKKLSKTVKQKV